MPEYLVVTDHDALLALIEADDNINARYRIRTTRVDCNFHSGNGRLSLDSKVLSTNRSVSEELMKENALNFEMEKTMLFTLCKFVTC